MPLEHDKIKKTSDSSQQQRTLAQNASIHLYLTQVATELEREGHTLQDIVQKITKVEITPTMHNLKEVVWREIQKAQLGKESTTFLTKHEVDKIYETMNKWLGTYFEIHIPFPSLEDKDKAPLRYH